MRQGKVRFRREIDVGDATQDGLANCAVSGESLRERRRKIRSIALAVIADVQVLVVQGWSGILFCRA